MAQNPPDASLDAEIELKKRSRRRLVGATALALLAAVVLPMVMDHEPKPAGQDIQVRIPSQEAGGFASRILPTKPTATPLPAPESKPVSEADNPERRFDDLHFAFDHYDLTDYSQALLEQDAATITRLSGKYPDLKVDISGHTDWVGTDAYNQALSERRANAAKDYLVKKGVDAARIRTYSFGETKPVAPNTTPEGRALNRRDEISTTNQK